jgi:SAM-dependent methyltransferase
MEHWLTDPTLKGLPMGSTPWFAAQRRMIAGKPLIKRCYDLWYQRLLADADSVPVSGKIVELGSGLSYVKTIRPEVITSDVEPGVADMEIDGRALPFEDETVQALLLTHVFHHIPDVGLFLDEAQRVLVPGGVISMVDETHTPFARFFFSRFHPEPYDDAVEHWDFPPGHTMLDSNQALSWVVFHRDARRFREQYPELVLEVCEYLPWLSYLLSGGVNLRSFVPRAVAPIFPGIDFVVKPLDGLFAIHWHLRIRKRSRDEKTVAKTE